MKYGIVVIAASAGGVVAIPYLLSGLPATFRVPILIVQHRGRTPCLLEDVLRHCTPDLPPFSVPGVMRVLVG